MAEKMSPNAGVGCGNLMLAVAWRAVQ